MTAHVLPIGAKRPASGAGLRRPCVAGPRRTTPFSACYWNARRPAAVPANGGDRHVVCLAVEGGGMRGSVSAGMCMALEAAGLVPRLRSGLRLLRGCGQWRVHRGGSGPTRGDGYRESASRRFIDARQLVRGGPAVDLELIFDELLARKRPFCRAGLAKGRTSARWRYRRAVAELRVLSDLRDPDDVLGAVRASCSVPLLNGAPHGVRGERLVDGGFLESIPYQERRYARVRRMCWFCVPATPATGSRHTEGSRSWPFDSRVRSSFRCSELGRSATTGEAEHLEAVGVVSARGRPGHPGHRPARRTARRTPRHGGDAEPRVHPARGSRDCVAGACDRSGTARIRRLDRRTVRALSRPRAAGATASCRAP